MKPTLEGLTDEHRRIIDSLFGESAKSRPPAPRIEIESRESAVYFIAVRGFIKIGWTGNWKDRISNLQTANPEPIDILLILGRPKVFERTMHRQFSEHRANGEWFKDHSDIRAYIESRQDECWYRAGRRQ